MDKFEEMMQKFKMESEEKQMQLSKREEKRNSKKKHIKGLYAKNLR